MNKQAPHVATDLECPTLKAKRHVEFAVNVFRDADVKGMEVETCSEFLGTHGKGSCGQACIHSQEAKRLHSEEAKKHREELAEIGPNVIG